ncbi:MAG: neutral/alkaline non-lysosomal ceramidase N-terminal domain-containing protein [Gemmataceae bacterium]|nr:neutral/alkaline non-lysosomal ceramidase N-terminal domain-containing protein [Gemmataceae bacterium]
MTRAFCHGVLFSVLALTLGGSWASADKEKPRVAEAAGDKPFKAGIASKVVTPSENLWLAGYLSRTKPAEGKLQDLHVKALALEDAEGGKLVLLTSDLITLPRSLSEAVAEGVTKRTGLPRERLLLTVSHTHCAPVLHGGADYYPTTPEDRAKIEAYTRQLQGWMIDTVVHALQDLKPARLAVGKGTARFAVNRREETPKGFINGKNPDGPVDHDVPVLRVETPEGKLRAVVFGYACHNTTLQLNQYSGDYAGFAQANLEAKHPGAAALFWAGCGGDANPLPRSTVELCKKYGGELSTSVEDVLKGPMTPVCGKSAARYSVIALPFDKLPTKEDLAADLLGKDVARRKRAERLTKTLESGGKLDEHYKHYPVQVWRLGDLLWVSLGGEVVVDYSFRLKKELASKNAVWITAYANDVMGYIPSARVLKEGGYEPDGSVIFTNLPARWSPAIEEKIVAKVHELAKATARVGKGEGHSSPSPLSREG